MLSGGKDYGNRGHPGDHGNPRGSKESVTMSTSAMLAF